MAAAASDPIVNFCVKFTENITSLYTNLAEKFVGRFSWFEDVVDDTEIKSLRDILAVYLNWKSRIQTGGARYTNLNDTYPVIPITSNNGKIVFPDINAEELEGNEIIKSNLESPNVVILGGGPSGLYMAILLKKTIPSLNVIVLENRVNPDTRRRKLERLQRFRFSNASLTQDNSLGEDTRFNQFKEDLTNAGLLDLLKLNDATLDLWQNLINVKGYPYVSIPINIVELRLAAIAQRMGIKIQHVVYGKGADEIEEYLQKTFVNPNLLAIFDATGGRVYDNFKDIAPKKTFKTLEGKNISIYESAVEPAIAVRLFADTQIPFIGIGDSIVRADFTMGNGLAINGMIMVFYALLFRTYYDRFFPSSHNSSNHNSSRPSTPSIPFPSSLEGGSGATRRARRRNRKTRRFRKV